MMAITETQTQTVFVAMPFRPEYDAVFDIIKRAGDIASVQVERVDQEAFTGSIVSRIRTSIESADLVVAVVSEASGNVYYEIGLAHCQKKPVILLTTDPKTLLFDLRDHRALIYDLNQPQQAVITLAKELSALPRIASDPKALLASRFGGLSSNSEYSYKEAIQKITDTLDLQEPVEVVQITRTSAGDVAVELRDFFRQTVRAVVDVNGMISGLQARRKRP